MVKLLIESKIYQKSKFKNLKLIKLKMKNWKLKIENTNGCDAKMLIVWFWTALPHLKILSFAILLADLRKNNNKLKMLINSYQERYELIPKSNNFSTICPKLKISALVV